MDEHKGRKAIDPQEVFGRGTYITFVVGIPGFPPPNNLFVDEAMLTHEEGTWHIQVTTRCSCCGGEVAKRKLSAPTLEDLLALELPGAGYGKMAKYIHEWLEKEVRR